MSALRPQGVAFGRAGQALWVAGALAPTLWAVLQPRPTWQLPIMVIGVLAPIHGCSTFVRSGGDRQTPSGLFSLTLGLLLGLGSYPVWTGEVGTDHLAVAAVTGYLVQVLATPVRASALAQMPPRQKAPARRR